MRMLNAADFQNGRQAKERNKRTKAVCTNFPHTPPWKRLIHTKKVQSCTILKSRRLIKPTKNWKSSTLGTAHASMSWDLSGKMKDLNIFVRKEKLCIPSENSLTDRIQTFHGKLFSEIKKLWSGHGRREDLEISTDRSQYWQGCFYGRSWTEVFCLALSKEEKWFTK